MKLEVKMKVSIKFVDDRGAEEELETRGFPIKRTNTTMPMIREDIEKMFKEFIEEKIDPLKPPTKTLPKGQKRLTDE